MYVHINIIVIEVENYAEIENKGYRTATVYKKKWIVINCYLDREVRFGDRG